MLISDLSLYDIAQTRFMIPMVRRIVPLVSIDIIGVQPMVRVNEIIMCKEAGWVGDYNNFCHDLTFERL